MTIDFDSECIELCKSLNRVPGIQTISSCWGHKKSTYKIWFLSKSLTCLNVLLYIINDKCPGEWRCETYHNNIMNVPIFMLEHIKTKGNKAYIASLLLAEIIDSGLDSDFCINFID